MTKAQTALLAKALDEHQRLIAKAEWFRSVTLEPLILRMAEHLKAQPETPEGNRLSALLIGDGRHAYLIDQRARVMTRLKTEEEMTQHPPKEPAP